jgi:hypothetical protein
MIDVVKKKYKNKSKIERQCYHTNQLERDTPVKQ